MSKPTDAPERGTPETNYDRIHRSLHGIPDATWTKPSTVRTVSPVLELPQTFIVQTVRHRERGDIVFVEYLGADGSFRVALPPAVAEAIARQRDALTTKARKTAGKQQAAARKAAGLQPAFLKGKKS